MSAFIFEPVVFDKDHDQNTHSEAEEEAQLEDYNRDVQQFHDWELCTRFNSIAGFYGFEVNLKSNDAVDSVIKGGSLLRQVKDTEVQFKSSEEYLEYHYSWTKWLVYWKQDYPIEMAFIEEDAFIIALQNAGFKRTLDPRRDFNQFASFKDYNKYRNKTFSIKELYDIIIEFRDKKRLITKYVNENIKLLDESNDILLQYAQELEEKLQKLEERKIKIENGKIYILNIS